MNSILYYIVVIIHYCSCFKIFRDFLGITKVIPLCLCHKHRENSNYDKKNPINFKLAID